MQEKQSISVVVTHSVIVAIFDWDIAVYMAKDTETPMNLLCRAHYSMLLHIRIPVIFLTSAYKLHNFDSDDLSLRKCNDARIICM